MFPRKWARSHRGYREPLARTTRATRLRLGALPRPGELGRAAYQIKLLRLPRHSRWLACLAMRLSFDDYANKVSLFGKPGAVVARYFPAIARAAAEVRSGARQSRSIGPQELRSSRRRTGATTRRVLRGQFLHRAELASS